MTPPALPQPKALTSTQRRAIRRRIKSERKMRRQSRGQDRLLLLMLPHTHTDTHGRDDSISVRQGSKTDPTNQSHQFNHSTNQNHRSPSRNRMKLGTMSLFCGTQWEPLCMKTAARRYIPASLWDCEAGTNRSSTAQTCRLGSFSWGWSCVNG